MKENIIFEYELKENEIFNITSVSGGATKVSIISYDDNQPAIFCRGANIRAKDSLDDDGKELFEKLRSLRMEIADSEGVRPYMVFNDKTLVDMIEKKPANLEELLTVKGVGSSKADKYGNVFIEALMGA